MSDLIKKEDVLAAIEEFREETFSEDKKKKWEKTGNYDHEAWNKAYKMGDLYSKVYRITSVSREEEPVPKAGRRKTAIQIVQFSGWAGEVHVCSKCGKIVPFIDWCQPFCAGCGCRFKNYEDFCRKDSPCEDCKWQQARYADGKRIPVCSNKKSVHYGDIEDIVKKCADSKAHE